LRACFDIMASHRHVTKSPEQQLQETAKSVLALLPDATDQELCQALRSMADICTSPTVASAAAAAACHVVLSKVVIKRAPRLPTHPTTSTVLAEVLRTYTLMADAIRKNTPPEMMAKVLQPVKLLTVMKDPQITEAARAVMERISCAPGETRAQDPFKFDIVAPVAPPPLRPLVVSSPRAGDESSLSRASRDSLSSPEAVASSAGARNWHVSDDERAGAAAPPATGGVLQRNRQRAASEHLSDDSSSVNPATCRAASGPSRASSQSVLKSKSMCQLSWAQDTHRDSAGSRCPRHVIDPAQRRRHRHSNSFVCGRGGDLAAEGGMEAQAGLRRRRHHRRTHSDTAAMMDQLSLMHRREDEEEDHEEEDDDEDDGGFGLRSGSGGGGGDRALQRTLTRMIDMARGPKRGNPLRGVEDIQLPQEALMAAASKKDKPWVVTYDQEARPYVVMPAKDVGEEAPEMSADVSMRRLLMQGLELQYLRKILLQKDMTILGIKSESEKAVRRLRSTSRKSASSYGDAAPYFVSDNSDSFSECGSYGSANGRLGELLAGLDEVQASSLGDDATDTEKKLVHHNGELRAELLRMHRLVQTLVAQANQRHQAPGTPRKAGTDAKSPQPLKEEHHRHPAATGACSCCGSHRTSNPANNDFLVAESKASFSSGGGLAARHARRLLPRTTSMPNVPDPMQTPSPSPSPSPSTHRFSRNRSVRDAEALVEDGITLFPESGAGREEDGARFDASKGAELNLKTRLALGLGEGHSRQLSAPTSLQVFNPIHPANQHAPGSLPNTILQMDVRVLLQEALPDPDYHEIGPPALPSLLMDGGALPFTPPCASRPPAPCAAASQAASSSSGPVGSPPPPPPPPLPRKGAPPRPGGQEHLLVRSGAVSALYRSLVLKCGPGKGNPTSPKKRFGAQANAHLERLVGELASKSHHARRVAEHAVQFRKRVEYMAKWVSLARLHDMRDALVLASWLEDGLKPLEDEASILRQCPEWPERRVDALREAVSTHNGLLSLVERCEHLALSIDSGAGGLATSLPKAAKLLEAAEKLVNRVAQSRERDERRFKELGVPFDWSTLTTLKHAISHVAGKLIKQASGWARRTPL